MQEQSQGLKYLLLANSEMLPVDPPAILMAYRGAYFDRRLAQVFEAMETRWQFVYLLFAWAHLILEHLD
jgi:hypothetical protein